MSGIYSFKGLAPRQEYWATILLSALVHMVATLIVVSVGFAAPGSEAIVILFAVPIAISATWITLAVSAKRCRDAGINAWWCVAQLVPYIGIVTFFTFGILKTKQEE